MVLKRVKAGKSGLILVIGGGAAGMMAAIQAKKQGAAVTVLERGERVGRKLSQTGNGRCNLTNTGAAPCHYHGDGAEVFCRDALTTFSPACVMEEFSSLGLLMHEEYGGRVYPYCNRADSVVDILRFTLDALDIPVKIQCTVTGIRRGKGDFSVLYTQGEHHGILHADRVILACGGHAAPKLGGTDLGLKLAAGLGHTVRPCHAALVQLVTADRDAKALKGVRADGVVQLKAGGTLRQASGEIQFTEYGLSGPAVFDIARAASAMAPVEIGIDLLPQVDEDALAGMLGRRCKALGNLTVNDLFTGILQNRLGRVCAQRAGLNLTMPLTKVTDAMLKACAHTAKDMKFTVTGDMGLEHAQVTAGGLCLHEFNPVTMESLRMPGLYACGELLDIDGDCGGYNLQWAWASGMAAGMAAGGKA